MLEPHIEEIDRLFNGDTVEEIVHNLKMEGSEWAKKQLDTLSKMVSRKRSVVHCKLSRFSLHLIYIKQILYIRAVYFRPCFFLPLLLEEIFSMFEFAQTKLCYKRGNLSLH